MEGYFERVVETLSAEGYRWYETANFCRRDSGARAPSATQPRRSGAARTTSASGSGRCRRLPAERRRNLPSVGRYVAALAAGEEPPREVEPLDERTRAVERVMLGLRLDEPFALQELNGARGVVDRDALEALTGSGLVERHADGSISLTPRGRLLGDGVTARLLA